MKRFERLKSVALAHAIYHSGEGEPLFITLANVKFKAFPVGDPHDIVCLECGKWMSEEK